MDAITKAVEATVEPIESEHPNGEFLVVLATDDLDRDKENLWADEWQTPLPAKIHWDTDHAFDRHKSVELTAGSAIPELDEDGRLVCRGVFAGTEHGQLTRQLVNEGHVWQASAAFIEHKSADGHITRELLNGTFCGVPNNTKAVVVSSKAADSNKPYGDVRYADPKNGKYPIDTEEHVRAAWSYINMPKNAAKYSSGELSAIKGRIRSAMRRHGIEASSDKALAVALANLVLKAFTDTVGAPGAPSAYQDGYDEQGDGTDQEPDNDEDEGAEAQAVHDAAVALGAQCDPQDSPTQKTYQLGQRQKAADTAEPATTMPGSPPSPADLHAAVVRKFKLTNALKEYNRDG